MKKLLFGLLILSTAAYAQSISPPPSSGGGGGGITALTGDCAASGTGSVTTTCIDKPHPGYLASKWYNPSGTTNPIAGSAVTANVIRCSYGGVYRKLTIGNVAFKITTPNAGNAQIALYSNVGSLPGNFLGSTANMSTAVAAAVTATLSPSNQIGPGGANADDNIWWCLNADNSVAVFTSFISSQQGGAAPFIGSATLNDVITGGAMLTGITCTGAACNGGSSTFGTWPPSLTGSTWVDITTTVMPLISFNPSSVP